MIDRERIMDAHRDAFAASKRVQDFYAPTTIYDLGDGTLFTVIFTGYDEGPPVHVLASWPVAAMGGMVRYTATALDAEAVRLDDDGAYRTDALAVFESTASGTTITLTGYIDADGGGPVFDADPYMDREAVDDGPFPELFGRAFEIAAEGRGDAARSVSDAVAAISLAYIDLNRIYGEPIVGGIAVWGSNGEQITVSADGKIMFGGGIVSDGLD